ncbi:cation diffusion facilitator family transporter [Propionibacteriaceae bacterium Y2011]
MTAVHARFGDTDLPEQQEQALRRAVRLEVVTVCYVVTAVAVVAAVMGNSQAMKAAWVEDLLSLLPPIAFLIAVRLVRQRSTGDYPYGFHRAIGAAHLTAAVALLGMGVFLIIQSATGLISAEHPTIGTVNLLGVTVWQGWLMIAALLYTGVPPVILGRLKMRLAEPLHDKVLRADADMNKADWATAGGAILGVIGIGLGLWWADAVVAIGIAISIVADGIGNLRAVVAGLLDRQARTHDDAEQHPLIDEVEELARSWPWVSTARVRMRDLGHVFHTEVFVVPADEQVALADLERASDEVAGLDWKLDDVSVVCVRELPEPGAEH